MKTNTFGFLKKIAVLSLLMFLPCNLAAQDDQGFWSKVHFGGSLGAAFGNGYTDVTVAPGAIYQFNRYVAAGAGLQGTYVNREDYFKSFIYGGSVIGLFNPIPEIQLSAEVEQLRVNLDVDDNYYGDYKRDFWNTALFLGAGYSMENVTVGIRYNVLFNEDDFVYSDSWMPFIRIYF